MKNKTLRPFLALALFALSFISCTKEDLLGNHEFSDPQGIKISLDWVLNDGSDATTWVDLDIALYKGTGDNKTPTDFSSRNSSSSELMTMPAAELADGEYTITIEHFAIDKPGMMTMTFNGMSVTKRYDISGKTFEVADEGFDRDLAKVKKSGNKFSVTPL